MIRTLVPAQLLAFRDPESLTGKSAAVGGVKGFFSLLLLRDVSRMLPAAFVEHNEVVIIVYTVYSCLISLFRPALK